MFETDSFVMFMCIHYIMSNWVHITMYNIYYLYLIIDAYMRAFVYLRFRVCTCDCHGHLVLIAC